MCSVLHINWFCKEPYYVVYVCMPMQLFRLRIFLAQLTPLIVDAREEFLGLKNRNQPCTIFCSLF